MIYKTIVSRQLIDKGWSGDQKYRVQTSDGKLYLLRISPRSMYERRKAEYERMVQAAALEISMCLPVEFGTCEEGVYTIHTWIDGEDAETAIPGLPEREQYAYGIRAGQILARLHTISAPEEEHDWEQYFAAKVRRKIAAYEACAFRYEHGEAMVNYLKENTHLLKNRPVTYQHGDYHIGNMMIGADGTLYVIDFEKDDFGDPWEEFNRITWSAQAAPEFARGILDGYFDNQVPQQFWQLMAYYICSNSVGSLPWAVAYEQEEVDTMIRQAGEILSWYDNMKQLVPSWYRKE